MKDKDEIGKGLLGFLREHILNGSQEGDVGLDYHLRSTGLIDSIDTLTLLTHVEQTFNVEFSPEEVAGESFDTIEGIVKLIIAKGSNG